MELHLVYIGKSSVDDNRKMKAFQDYPFVKTFIDCNDDEGKCFISKYKVMIEGCIALL